MNKVSVVILNWNGVGFLKQFLPGVVKNSNFPGCEIVVADNGSEDNSVDYIRANFSEIKIVQFEKNYGFAAGYNKALEQLHSEYYILLNSDVEVTENWILPIIKYMDLNPEVGSCMPKMLSFYNPNYFEYAGAAGGFIDKYGFAFCRGRVFNTIEKDFGQYNDLCEIFWASGACMIVKAEAYWKVGGLDQEFFAHMEEIDLCWRLQWHGYKIIYFPEVKVFHVGGGSLNKENPQKTYLNFRNNLYLLYKNLPSPELYKVLFYRIFLDFLAAIYYIVNIRLKHFSAIIKAHINFFMKLSYFRRYRLNSKFLKEKRFFSSGILNGSLVTENFIKRKRTYNKIIS